MEVRREKEWGGECVINLIRTGDSSWPLSKNALSQSPLSCWRSIRRPSRTRHNFTADLGAESIQSIELVAMFEEEFGIEMEEDAALAVDTVGKAIEFITKVCKEQGVEV